MADISAIKLPNNTTLNLKDASALKQLEFADHSLVALTRAGTSTTIDLGEFDTLSVTDLNAGNLVTTGVGRFTNGLYGNLTGNADTATKATQDESGNNIKASYAASFSISDHTITLKNKNGVSLGTVTVPDNNTTYTIATGDSNGQIKVTPSSGSAYNVSVKGLGSNAYTSTSYLPLDGGEMTGPIKWNATSLVQSTGFTYLVGIDAFASGGQMKWSNASAVTVGAATKATQDSDGNAINTTYMKKSGGTFTGAVTLSGDPTANLHAATKQYVDTQLANGIAASDAMVFKGTVGTGGTATSLPTSSVVVGDTYKAISTISIAAGSSWTGSEVSAKSGDLIVAMANTPKWIVVPSGDETVTTIKYSTTTQNLTTSAQSGAITVGEAATKQVVTSIDTSANLPTANAVKTFVENKGYVTSSGVTSVATGVGLTGGTITGTGTIKAKLKSETNATYDSASVTNTSSRQYAVVPDKSGYLSVNVPWTAYSSGTGISVSNGVINHSNAVTAGTAGTSSATSGPTIAIPYVTYDAQGHVTAVGTHTHTVNGALSVTSLSASSYVTVNSGNSGTSGGVALYSTSPTTYGITMRQTSNQGKHGYVQGDWAIYNHMSGAVNRGFVWKLDSNSVASISGDGNAVFNGSLTVGGNAGNTSGCRMEFDSTLKCVNWIFN